MRALILAIALSIPFAVAASAQTASVSFATDEWPPYEYTQDGEVTGLSTDVIRAVMAEMGVTIDSIDAVPWTRAIKLINAGRVAGVYSGAYNEKRAAILLYPETPLVESSWAVFVRAADRDATPFASWDDLKTGIVGVVRGYAYDPEFDAFYKENAEFAEADDNETNFKKLMAGRVDYVVCDLINGLHIMKQQGIQDQVHAYIDKPIAETEYFAFFSPQVVDDAFVTRFDETLKAFRETDAYTDILDSYLK
ncbi:substrate-binding periplasmic protein [Roseospira goensis]|uniref:Polar amino acid transport system substrate-binding protein n=1 Tax=Roseospira goensis TaxID=391922 RepID=A0A7W6S1I4_9PROT|nr:transporter substrate-binding domain-containing protein [Roseospira goensis]MBB4287183.1 polar amino acid transport system substrate-binding protein [Roseospira goensis]